MNLKLIFIRLQKLYVVSHSAFFLKVLLFNRILVGAENRPIFNTNFNTIIDIGANHGQFALAARKWAPNARIISFEPLSQAALRFQKVFHEDPNVMLHQVAIGPQTGTSVIHVAGSDDSSSLLPITALQEKLFPGTGEVRTEKIHVGRLSEFISIKEIKEPALLKLDVQGFELEALKGCEDLLDCFSHVYVECSFVELYSGQALAHDIISWLAKHGFKLSGIYNTYYDPEGRCVQADCLFEKK